MSSRSARRRKHKQLQRLAELPDGQKPQVAALVLAGWQIEARRRARSLSTPTVWGLALDSHTQAITEILDSTGELKTDLHRVCAETVSEAAGQRLLLLGRPSVERPRCKRR